MTLWVKGLLTVLLLGSSGGIIAGNYFSKRFTTNKQLTAPEEKQVEEKVESEPSADRAGRVQQESLDKKDLSSSEDSLRGGQVNNDGNSNDTSPPEAQKKDLK